jgi:hypothetical protein
MAGEYDMYVVVTTEEKSGVCPPNKPRRIQISRE